MLGGLISKIDTKCAIFLIFFCFSISFGGLGPAVFIKPSVITDVGSVHFHLSFLSNAIYNTFLLE